jgi:hypothetical protein
LLPRKNQAGKAHAAARFSWKHHGPLPVQGILLWNHTRENFSTEKNEKTKKTPPLCCVMSI